MEKKDEKKENHVEHYHTFVRASYHCNNLCYDVKLTCHQAILFFYLFFFILFLKLIFLCLVKWRMMSWLPSKSSDVYRSTITRKIMRSN